MARPEESAGTPSSWRGLEGSPCDWNSLGREPGVHAFAGRELAIDYNAAPFETVVHDVDAVMDTVGGELAHRSFKVLRPDGIYVTVAGRLPEDAGKAEGVRAMGAGRA